MSDAFDPYYRWLGIPPKDQPPDHYRLLSLERFESHADVIAEAADRQMAHLRTRQSGHHAAQAAKLLNEIAAARVCLLSPSKKAAYDTYLAKLLSTRPYSASNGRWGVFAAATLFCLLAGWLVFRTIANNAAEDPGQDLSAQQSRPAAPLATALENETGDLQGSAPASTDVQNASKTADSPTGATAESATASSSPTKSTSSNKAAPGVWRPIDNSQGRVKPLPTDQTESTTSAETASPAIDTTANKAPQPEVADNSSPTPVAAADRVDPELNGSIEPDSTETAQLKISQPEEALPRGEEVARYAVGKYPLASFAVSADGQRVVNCNSENRLSVIDLKESKEIQTLSGADLKVEHLAAVPDGRFFMASGITADDDRAQLRTYRVDDAMELTTLPSANGPVTVLRINFNGAQFATGHRLGLVSLNSTQDTVAPVLFYARQRNAEITTLAFSSENQQLVFGDSAGEVHVALISTRKPNVQQHLEAHDAAIVAISINSRGDLLLTAAADGAITVWQNWRGRDAAKAKLKISTGALQANCAALSPSGNLIASASDTGEITLWDASSGKAVAALAGHSAAIIGLSFLPDGKRLVSASRDSTVRIWNCAAK